jgi:hypothetical protein
MARINQYFTSGWRDVEGWINRHALAAIGAGATYQEILGITGDGLEIGVFQGRSFLGICAALSPGDTAVAVDIFDDQSLNFDGSGKAANLMQIFTDNVAAHAPKDVKVEVMAADSLALQPQDILARAQQRFRIISIDGGHTAEHVMNDLALASAMLVNGALVILDDWMSPHWPGVQEGYVRYMANANTRLAPVFYVENKLFMTTISHQPNMRDFFGRSYKFREQMDVREVQSGAFKFLSAI